MIGDQFTQALGLVRDSYIQDVDDIATEERSMKTRWNSRKKQAEIRLDAMANIFGNLKVIADKIPAMKELDQIEAKLLTGPEEDLES